MGNASSWEDSRDIRVAFLGYICFTGGTFTSWWVFLFAFLGGWERGWVEQRAIRLGPLVINELSEKGAESVFARSNLYP
jgi:hypothetical protein